MQASLKGGAIKIKYNFGSLKRLLHPNNDKNFNAKFKEMI